jgi:hypothetical protein
MTSLLALTLLVAADPLGLSAAESANPADRVAMRLLVARVDLSAMRENYTQDHPALALQEGRVRSLEAVLQRLDKAGIKPDRQAVLTRIQFMLAAAGAELARANEIYTEDHPHLKQLMDRVAGLTKIAEKEK